MAGGSWKGPGRLRLFRLGKPGPDTSPGAGQVHRPGAHAPAAGPRRRLPVPELRGSHGVRSPALSCAASAEPDSDPQVYGCSVNE